MADFSIVVACEADGPPHDHTIVIGSAPGSLGVSRPAAVRVQYTCPLTGEPFIATFTPPVDAARPFAIRSVQ